MDQGEVLRIRRLLRQRREVHRAHLRQEVERLTGCAATLGVQRVILFGSLARDEDGLTSDLDLLIVWDTPLDFLERAVEPYRRLQPRVATDLLVYTPVEMTWMSQTPWCGWLYRKDGCCMKRDARPEPSSPRPPSSTRGEGGGWAS